MPPAQIPPEVKWYSKELKSRSVAIKAADEGNAIEVETRQVLEGLIGTLEDDSLAHLTSQHAMAKLAGAKPPTYPIAQPRDYFEIACFAWLNLENATVRHWFERLDPIFEEDTADSEAIRIQQIQLWVQAMWAFAHGEKEASKRFWQQAVKISGSFGTDAHPTIAWTYAATFTTM